MSVRSMPSVSASAKLLDPEVEEHSSTHLAAGEPKPPQTQPQTETPFGLDVATLSKLNCEQDMDHLSKLGGVEGLIKALNTSRSQGIDAGAGDCSVEGRQLHFGQNRVPPLPPVSFFALMWGNLQDPILLLLIFAAAVSTGLGAGLPEQRAKGEWIEGVAIWVAVLLVSGVGAANDYQKEMQFRKLNEKRECINVKVLRGGSQQLVTNHEVVVGDILLLDSGDKIIADCILVDFTQTLVLDESSLTGESEPVKKNQERDPWIRSGTQVSEGTAKALVIAVGPNSEWVKTMMLINEAGDDKTPLQEKLEVVAGLIGKVGFAVAIATFTALMIEWCVVNKGFPVSKINDHGPIQFFLYAITIIVVAVPEGLPLAVTISLAYSMKKMLTDQNFVRHLSACETMGGVTAICSDKTGTLTENKMTVVEGWFSGTKLDHVPLPTEIPAEVLAALRINIAMNSKAFLIQGVGERMDYVGSSTECALLMLLKSWGDNYADVRKEREADLLKLFGFSSARKMSSVLLRHEGRYRLFNKGAAEWVLQRCTHACDREGKAVEMGPEMTAELTTVITSMAQRGLRCICLTYTDFELQDQARPEDFFEDPENTDRNLTVLAIVGIKDPVRKEVPGAVAVCQKAGITVRMVTGDNIHTAKHIARECHILWEDDHVAMEGPDFRAMNESHPLELQKLLPSLRVLARSSPEDKLTLVKLLKEQGHVVAVTGDGTNDAPALKESDVGLAMGIAGTEVAKEAADIIILDDNFTSIVKSVLWGRSVFNNIRKFLQFQLTVNCSALIIVFIGSVVGMMEPLNVLQLLWVNLIMDTMGALALATEAPSPSLLDDPPNGRDTSLINGKMWKHIILQGIFQVFVMLMCLYVVPVVFTRYSITSETNYYFTGCNERVSSHLGIPIGNGSYNNGTWPDATWYCQVMQFCGFPLEASLENTAACPLYTLFKPTPVPTDSTSALCINTSGQGCEVHSRFSDARDDMHAQLVEQQRSDWKKPLSLLFNAFIMMQIFNEICSRRINDEYDFFSGLLSSPIFMSVLVITFGLQAIIMNFLGMFFQVVPLDWQEWLICIAIGFGSCIMSWIIRFVSRNAPWSWDVLQLRRNWNARQRAITGTGRTDSGRTGSGRVVPTGAPHAAPHAAPPAASGRPSIGSARVVPVVF